MDDSISGVSGSEAFARLSAEIYRPEIGRFLFSRPTLFNLVAKLSSQIAVRRLMRRPEYSRLVRLAKLVEADALEAQRHTHIEAGSGQVSVQRIDNT